MAILSYRLKTIFTVKSFSENIACSSVQLVLSKGSILLATAMRCQTHLQLHLLAVLILYTALANFLWRSWGSTIHQKDVTVLTYVTLVGRSLLPHLAVKEADVQSVSPLMNEARYSLNSQHFLARINEIGIIHFLQPTQKWLSYWWGAMTSSLLSAHF